MNELERSMEMYEMSEEFQYTNLLRLLFEHGTDKTDRTGVGTKSMTFHEMSFNLQNYRIPVFTTKKVYWKGVVEELLWFIRGETDSKILENKGVNIWKGNTSREFLDGRGLVNVPEGDIGTGYGYQWRNWGGDYTAWIERGERTGIDQLQNLIDGLKTDPHSRRHIINSWNVSQLESMSLPPCHMMCQFVVQEDELDCIMYQRSVDTFLGLPFNIASYSLFTRLIAHYTGFKPGFFHWVGGDVHLYNNHIEQAKEQYQRESRQKPLLDLVNMPSRIEDVTIDNIVLIDYDPHPPIKADMAV